MQFLVHPVHPRKSVGRDAGRVSLQPGPALPNWCIVLGPPESVGQASQAGGLKDRMSQRVRPYLLLGGAGLRR
jgi:hypothetical protein